MEKLDRGWQPDGLQQPLRQSVYALLFNLHHQNYKKKEAEDLARSHRRKAEDFRKQAKKSTSEDEKSKLISKAEQLMKQAADVKIPDEADIRIREWLPYNNYDVPNVVTPLDLNWATPTLQRLWFGTSVEDKEKRIRAFLTCMRSDSAPALLSTAQVPQHFLLMACVLRYIMAAPAANVILRRPELDAILATAFSPELRNPKFLSNLKMTKMTPRGVLLGTLLMQGVDMGILANDACGAPIPFQMCLPWTFFDGKLFQTKLKKAETARNLMELCDGRMEVVYAIERMRTAILQGLVPQFSGMAMAQGVGPGVLPMQIRGALGAAAAAQHPMMTRGQVTVGGMVTGNWGANYGAQAMHLQRMQQQYQAKGKQQQKKKKKNKAKGKATTDSDDLLEPGKVRVMNKNDADAEELTPTVSVVEGPAERSDEDFKPRRAATATE